MVNDDYFGECVKRNNTMPVKVGSQCLYFNNDNSHKYFCLFPPLKHYFPCNK